MCIFCSKGIICIRVAVPAPSKSSKGYRISTDRNGNFISNLCCFRRIITDCMIALSTFAEVNAAAVPNLLCLEVQSKCVAELFFFTITSNPYNSIGRIIRNGISFTKSSYIQCQLVFIITKLLHPPHCKFLHYQRQSLQLPGPFHPSELSECPQDPLYKML